jgi:large subunit ribosomal protein L13
MKTAHLRPEEVQRTWYEVDATGHTVGRLASEIARVLAGKHKVDHSRHVDCGDFVIVTNADKLEFRGNKWNLKIYYNHSLYPGGLRRTTAAQMRDKHPDRIIHGAVRGMLPKNRLRSPRLLRLKIYTSATHPHQAQKPVAFPAIDPKSKR